MRKALTIEGVLRQLRSCAECKTNPILSLGGIPICREHWGLYAESLCFDGKFYLDNGEAES